MILVIFLWILILFDFSVIGFSVAKIICRISGSKENIGLIKPDEFFFIGFLTLSFFSGILSIFIPVGNIILICVSLFTLFLFLINFREINEIIQKVKKGVTLLSRVEFFFLIFLFIFILTAVVQKITLGDTESYHAQSIQWVRKFAVVPGLGNIHGRLAFNSMFFVISGLFAFQIKDILIFPLNGICYLVLAIRLFSLYKKENNQGTRWKAVLYLLTLLISLLIMIPDLNSPSTDIICAILVIYSFIIILNLEKKESQTSLFQFILLNLVVLSCITFKISSLFLIASLLFLFNKKNLNRIWITVTIGILVFFSFIIRNYYLSGYLIYPFPAIDIFNVDWKIPYDDVLSMKLEIESWAKISTIPASDVIGLRVSQWIIPWFHLLNFNAKLILTVNAFSIISIIIMLFKRDFFLAKIQFIILINLIFWFLRAPDPRFAYGFIFLGFSLNIAFVLKLFENSSGSGLFKYVRISLACFLILIICRRIMIPVDTLRNPSRWILPASFGTVETREYFSDFHYRVPVPEGGCFNVEIPCVPYPLANIAMRGKNIQDGFKVVKKQVPTQ